MGKTIFKIVGIAGTALFSCFNVLWLIFHNVAKLQNVLLKGILISILVIIGLFIITAAVYNIISVISEQRKNHKLKIDSKNFYQFFAKWYKVKGHLHIVCDDLSWIDDEINNVLLQKNGDLTLFIANNHRHDERVTKLEKNGASIKIAPKNVVEKYSFSYVEYMGNSFHIIFRDKSADENGFVKFEELKLNSVLTKLIKNSLGEKED